MLRQIRVVVITALVLGLNSNSVFAEDQMFHTIKRLSAETALTIAKATLDACRKEGVQIAVTVVDRGGHPQVVLRDVFAPDLTLNISRQKAYTAMAFNVPTSQMEGQFKHHGSIAKIDGIVFSAGGVPIQAAGTSYGGIGVSGAPSGKTDEKCARAGLAAVVDDLELAN
jgi:uncharacterized protein GlcG (DUF336 family)